MERDSRLKNFIQSDSNWRSQLEPLHPLYPPSTFTNIPQQRDDTMNTEVIIKLEPEDNENSLYEDTTQPKEVVETVIKLEYDDTGCIEDAAQQSKDTPAMQETVIKHEYVNQSEDTLQQRVDQMNKEAFNKLIGEDEAISEQRKETVGSKMINKLEHRDQNNLLKGSFQQREHTITMEMAKLEHGNDSTNVNLSIGEDSLTGNHDKVDVALHKCTVCGKQFTQKSGLTRHMVVHSGEKRYTCNICNKQFYRHWNLVRHNTKHSVEKRPVKKEHWCLVCGNFYTTNSNLKAHMLIHTGNNMFKCSLCPKEFSQKSSLQHHEVAHTGKKSYECVICQKQFTQKSGLTRHMQVHSGEKPFKCFVCNKSFHRRWNLERHTLHHTGERKSECTICGKYFSNLRGHMVVHTRAKAFKCKLCSDEFTNKIDLVQHNVIHTGDKLHQCSICAKKFTQKQGLRRHVKAHFGEPSYECDVCGKRFIRHWNLLRHSTIHTHKNKHVIPKFTKDYNLTGHADQHTSEVSFDHTMGISGSKDATPNTVTDKPIRSLCYLLASSPSWISHEQLLEQSLVYKE